MTQQDRDRISTQAQEAWPRVKASIPERAVPSLCSRETGKGTGRDKGREERGRLPSGKEKVPTGTEFLEDQVSLLKFRNSPCEEGWRVSLRPKTESNWVVFWGSGGCGGCRRAVTDSLVLEFGCAVLPQWGTNPSLGQSPSL